jgi:hypothetical protein
MRDNNNNSFLARRQVKESRMAPAGWEGRVNAADSAAEVIAIARDFMASLDRLEITQLPVACRPRKLATANDVTSYAFDLLAYETTTNDGTAKLIFRLATFFASASNRLARFHGPSPRMSDEEVRRFVPRASESEEP